MYASSDEDAVGGHVHVFETIDRDGREADTGAYVRSEAAPVDDIPVGAGETEPALDVCGVFIRLQTGGQTGVGQTIQ